MIPLPLILVGAMALVASVARALQGSAVASVGAVPVALQRLIERVIVTLREHTASADELRQVADQAEEYGQARLAKVLRTEADVIEAAERFAAGERLAHEDIVRYVSPIAGVEDAAWTAYVKRSRVARPRTVSPSYRLGVYALTTRELNDVAMMDRAHKGPHPETGRTVWLGTWPEGRSLEQFLSSPTLQYGALAELAKLHATAIQSRQASAIGREIEKQKATLSGLLAVALRAGVGGGFASWLESAQDRAGHPDTTAAFVRLNGIF